MYNEIAEAINADLPARLVSERCVAVGFQIRRQHEEVERGGQSETANKSTESATGRRESLEIETWR
jgi:hypothetical protein